MSVLPKLFKLFYGYWQTYSEVYVEEQKIQNSQHNIEKEQRGLTLQDLLWSYSNQESVVLANIYIYIYICKIEQRESFHQIVLEQQDRCIFLKKNLDADLTKLTQKGS